MNVLPTVDSFSSYLPGWFRHREVIAVHRFQVGFGLGFSHVLHAHLVGYPRHETGLSRPLHVAVTPHGAAASLPAAAIIALAWSRAAAAAD